MRLAAILLVGAFAAACATPAPDNAPTTAVADAQSKKICKRITMTGSNMPTTQCRSAAEWGAVEKIGRQDVEEFERARDNLTVGQ